MLPEVNKQNSDIPTVKPTILKKLNDSEPNLFLGVPEVIHINGTSSIKPRKGVHYTKIVPRKGVDTEIEGNETDLRPDFCLWTNESKCDVVFNKESKECLCCKNNVTHNLQHLLNCSNCNSENILLEKDNCYKICCENEINDNYNVKLNEIEDKKTSNSINSMKTAKKISLQPHEKKEKNLEDKHLNLFITKEKINLNLTKKLKPDITKVPYDIEVVSGLINSKKEVLVPVAASIFLLPLIGIFIFFIWRRTKEYWDKRYYKRMDFLIDGMYND